MAGTFRETGTKATWANPEVIPEAQRANGGWYYNPASGSVDRWWNDGSGAQSTPTSKEQVTPYLNDFQQNLYSTSSSPEVKVPTMDELRTQLTPATNAPDPLNRVAEFEKLRDTYKVADAEQSLNDLKAQEDQLYAEFRQQRTSEQDKTVPLNVIQGRIGEEERQYRERLDYVTREKSKVIDELNTKYNLIKTYIDLEGLDYKDAVDRYDKEFEKNVKMYDIISGKEKEARSAFEADRDAARANLQIYTNAITKGNLDFGSLSGDQQILINKLEVQAGLPIGFMSSIKKDKDADILFTTSNEGVTQVGLRNPNGTISVQSYGTRIKAATEGDKKQDYLTKIETNLRSVSGGDGFVSPDDYAAAISDAVRAGYTPEQANAILGKYKNRSNTNYYLPGE